MAGLRWKFAEHLLLGCVQADPLQGLPRFPWALSDPRTCPGPRPPLFAVIRATKRICCSWGWGPREALAKHERFQRKRRLQPARRCQERLGSTGHLEDSERVPLPRDPCLAPSIPPRPSPLGAEAILSVLFMPGFCSPERQKTLCPRETSKELKTAVLTLLHPFSSRNWVLWSLAGLKLSMQLRMS